MFDKMKQLMEMKKQAEQIKRELDYMNVSNASVAGIKIVINGSQEIQSIEISDDIVRNQSKQSLETDLARAVNAAVKQSQDLAAQKMKDVLPGFPGL